MLNIVEKIKMYIYIAGKYKKKIALAAHTNKIKKQKIQINCIFADNVRILSIYK